jgi:hypothetical protein
MADIGLSFWANAEWFWAPSSASLIDLTTSQTIWNYGWLEDGVGMNFDWTDWNYDENGSLVSVSALLTLNTLLLATHHYELAFTTFVNANAGDCGSFLVGRHDRAGVRGGKITGQRNETSILKFSLPGSTTPRGERRSGC